MDDKYSPEKYPKIAWGIELAVVPDDGRGFELLDDIYSTRWSAKKKLAECLDSNVKYGVEDIYRIVKLELTKVHQLD